MKVEWYIDSTIKKAVLNQLKCSSEQRLEALLDHVYGWIGKFIRAAEDYDKPTLHFVPLCRFLIEWDFARETFSTMYADGRTDYKNRVICISPSRNIKDVIVHEFIHWHRPELSPESVEQAAVRLAADPIGWLIK